MTVPNRRDSIAARAAVGMAMLSYPAAVPPSGAAPLVRRCPGLVLQQQPQQQQPQLAPQPASSLPPSLPSLRLLGNHQHGAAVHHALQGALTAAVTTAAVTMTTLAAPDGALPPLSRAPLQVPRRMSAADGHGCACGKENSCLGRCVACPSRGRMVLGAVGGPRAQRDALSPTVGARVMMR